MPKSITKIPISDIYLDEKIYPREKIDQNRVGIFADNIRDNFIFDLMKSNLRSLENIVYWMALIDGVRIRQRLTEAEAVIRNLDGIDPLLYAATKAIGPRQLTEEETKNTARRIFQNNPRLTSSEIRKAIGRSRRTVDSYIADLRAVTQMDLELKIFRMNRLGIPQERIAGRLGEARETIRNHLAKKAKLPNQPKADLSRGYTVSQVAEKQKKAKKRGQIYFLW